MNLLRKLLTPILRQHKFWCECGISVLLLQKLSGLNCIEFENSNQDASAIRPADKRAENVLCSENLV